MIPEFTKDVSIYKVNKSGTLTGRRLNLHRTGLERDMLGEGNEAEVLRVYPFGGDFFHGFAYKRYEDGERAKHSIAVREFLRSIRVSTPRTYRLVEEEGESRGILMTDLTRNWRDLLITSNFSTEFAVQNVQEDNPETIARFVNFDLESHVFLKKLYGQLSKMAAITALNRIEFEKIDVVFAIFTQEGDMRLMISDMGSIAVNSSLPTPVLFTKNLKNALPVYSYMRDAQKVARRMS